MTRFDRRNAGDVFVISVKPPIGQGAVLLSTGMVLHCLPGILPKRHRVSRPVLIGELWLKELRLLPKLLLPCAQQHLRVWLLGDDALEELIDAQPAVTVQIQPPDNGDVVLVLDALRERPAEEVVNALDVDEADRLVVNRLVARIVLVVGGGL